MNHGVWLLARLWLHYEYNRGLHVGRQEIIWGLDLNSVDRLEVSRLSLALAEARQLAKFPRKPG